MRKLVILLLLGAGLLASAGSAVWAATTGATAPGVGPAGQEVLKFLGQTAQKGGLTSNPDAPTDVATIIAGVINAILGLVGIVFFLQMFYAGFRWMTAEGAEEVIKESKGSIKGALIGIVIVMSAFALTNFVLSRLETVSQGVPAGSEGAGGNQAPGGDTPK